MIKQGIKNYLVNLKYIFTPLGVLSLISILCLSGILPYLISNTNQMFNSVEDILQSTRTDIDVSFQSNVYDSILALDWSNPKEAITNLLNKEWYIDILTKLVNRSQSGINLEQFDEIFSNYTQQLTGVVIVSIVMTFLGFFLGFVFTKFLVRKDIARRGFKKFILYLIIDSLISASLVSTCAFLFAYWNPSIYFTSIASLVLYGFISLVESYIIHGFKKISFKEVVNWKNLGYLLTSNFIVLAMSIVFVLIITLITNNVVGTVVGLIFFEIALIIVDLNAEAYVKNRTSNVQLVIKRQI